jgi:hypothetical protein
MNTREIQEAQSQFSELKITSTKYDFNEVEMINTCQIDTYANEGTREETLGRESMDMFINDKQMKEQDDDIPEEIL